MTILLSSQHAVPQIWLRRTLLPLLLLTLGTVASSAQDTYLPPHPEVRRPGTTVRIELIGDSTQTDSAGYGRGFCANLSPQVECINLARGGASTKTYREQGLWDRSLTTRPDYMLIQFGHNDLESPEHLDRQVSVADYEKNLRRFVDEARAAQIKPILVTPLSRRYFSTDGKVHSDLLALSAIMKRVAAEMKVPLIDLQTQSITYLDALGEARAKQLGITKKEKDGSLQTDKTHLNWAGSYVFGRIVAAGLGTAAPELSRYVLKKPATLPAEGLLAMRVFERQPFKIVLVGDSTVATGGGWGPGFCATLTANVTCVDLAANGRSTKSFIDEGLWQKALAEKGQYYFIQFGHNDQKPSPQLHADPDTLYSENLRRYIDDVRSIGAFPIIVSPLTRRTFKDGKLAEDGLKAYATAARNVASEEKVTFVDLLSLSQKYLGTQTQQQADTLNALTHPDTKAENSGPAKPDRTHLNDAGRAIFGRMVADDVIRTQVELGPNVKGLPKGQTPVLPLPPDTRPATP